VGRYVELLLEGLSSACDDGAAWAVLTNRPPRHHEPLPARARWSSSGPPRRPTLAWLQLAAPAAIARAGAGSALMPTGRAPLRCPVPFVAVVHDLTLLDRPELYPARERWLAGLWLRASIRRAAAIACVSAATARDLERCLPATGRRVAVVHEAVAVGFRRPQPPERVARLRAELGLGPRVWLHVGELSHRKNLPRLVQAFGIARGRVGDPPPVLALAGPSGPAAGEVRRAVSDTGLQGAVHRLGWVEDDDLPALYAASELAVCASLHEGFGLPALEAMACGIPLVCSMQGGLAEVVGEAALAADPASTAAMAAALESLGSDDALRQRLGAAGRVRSAAFEPARMAERIEALCLDVALPRRPARGTMRPRSSRATARRGSSR